GTGGGVCVAEDFRYHLRMSRPKNAVPTTFVAARIPAPLARRVHEAAGKADLRVGQFLTGILERALEEDTTRLAEVTTALLASKEAELSEARSGTDAGL